MDTHSGYDLLFVCLEDNVAFTIGLLALYRKVRKLS